MEGQPVTRFLARDLPFVSRLVLAVFLLSVGLGYFSALVQLHFHGGPKPGEALPGPAEAMRTYGGERGPKPQSHLERLLEANEDAPFNGAGQMRTAFNKKSLGWNRELNKAKGAGDDAVKKLRDEREGERLGMLEWLRALAPTEAYDKDAFPLSDALKDQPITADFVIKEDGMPPRLKIKTLFVERCVSCHAPDAGRMKEAEKYSLDSYDKIAKYTEVKVNGGMSLPKLAQTTHVHLLAFSMLYGLTGFIFSFTSYPAVMRLILSPWPLLWQVADISCWWLARLPSPQGDLFGQAIAVTGGLVAAGLGLQIILTIFDLFDKKGKFVVLLLIVAAAAVGGVLFTQVIGPHLAMEKAAAAKPE